MIKNPGLTSISKCVIVDDPPENINVDNDDTFNTQLLVYASYLSHILDSKYYNQFIKPLLNGKIKKVRINDEKFFAIYQYNGEEYYGECFDYRLIKENIDELTFFNDRSAKEIFDLLTSKIGKTKFFVGINKKIIEAINSKDESYLAVFESPVISEFDKKRKIFLDRDGVLIVKSIDSSDKQLERLLTEEEVFNRLTLFANYVRREAHECGAPCTSRDIEGKPCEIMTFREYCHFHR